jgi:hypothetical protein
LGCLSIDTRRLCCLPFSGAFAVRGTKVLNQESVSMVGDVSVDRCCTLTSKPTPLARMSELAGVRSDTPHHNDACPKPARPSCL